MPAITSIQKEGRRIFLMVGEGPGASLTRQHWAVLATLWVICTLLLFLFRPGYGFPPFRVLDGWIYTAYQWDLLNQIKDFGPTYYGSRLSWILPGALIHSFLPLVAAQVVFKSLVSATFATACALTVIRAGGFRAAIVAVILSVLSPPFIAALHSDYIDTAVIVYAALALACITAARDSRFWPWLIFLGGCFYAGMVIANLSALASIGAGIAIYHLTWLRWNIRRHVVSVILYAVAATVVCLGLGWIHRRLGGDFNFLKPQIGMIDYMRNLKVNPWIPTDRWWFIQATWLVLPVGILLWGLWQSAFSPPAEPRHRQLVRALTAALATSVALAFYLQVRELNATLSFAFYASFHLALALPLAAACLVSTPWSTITARYFAGTILALLAAVFFWDAELISKHLQPMLPFVSRLTAMPLFLTCTLLAGATLIAICRRRFAHSWWRIFRPDLLLVGLFVCSIAFDFHGQTLSDHLRERYTAVHTAYRTLEREFPAGSYRYWVHPDNDNGISLASTKLWGFRLFTLKRFPEFDTVTSSDDQVIIIPAPPGRGAEVLAELPRLINGPRLELINQRIIPIPGAAGNGFDLVCFTARRTLIDPESSPEGLAGAKRLVELRADSVPPYPAGMYNIFYGTKRDDTINYAAGYPVFTRTHPNDHLAIEFVDLQPAKPGVTRELSLIATMPANGQCSCMVQNKEGKTLAQLTFTKAGRSVHMIQIPFDISNMRIYLYSKLDRPTPLPSRIAIYELPQQP